MYKSVYTSISDYNFAVYYVHRFVIHKYIIDVYNIVERIVYITFPAYRMHYNDTPCVWASGAAHITGP